MEKRLFCLDIDGTLKPSRQAVPAENKKSIEDLQKANHLVTTATGRTLPMINFDSLGFVPNTGFVLEDGARVIDPQTQENLHVVPMQNFELAGAMYLLSQEGLRYSFYTDYNTNQVYAYATSREEKDDLEKYIKQDIVYFDDPADLIQNAIDNGGCCQLIVRFMPDFNSQAIDLASCKLNSHFMPGPSIVGSTSSVHPELGYTDPVGKHTGIGFLQNMEEVSMDNTIVAGNDVNDMSMFDTEVASHRILVGDDYKELAPKSTDKVNLPSELGSCLRKFL